MVTARIPVGVFELRGRGIGDGQCSPKRAVRVEVFSPDLKAERPPLGHVDGRAPRERKVAADGLIIDRQDLISVSEDTKEGGCPGP